MAAPRRVIELGFTESDLVELMRLARSRTEPASRVERARTLLAYRFFLRGRSHPSRAIGVTDQTVERFLRRAERFGVIAALDDSPRPGRERVITEEARTFVVHLASRKPKSLGYPHELWTTRLLTRHIREHGPAAGTRMPCQSCSRNVVQYPRRLRDQAAQGALLSGTSRSLVRREDGRRLVRLS